MTPTQKAFFFNISSVDDSSFFILRMLNDANQFYWGKVGRLNKIPCLRSHNNILWQQLLIYKGMWDLSTAKFEKCRIMRDLIWSPKQIFRICPRENPKQTPNNARGLFFAWGASPSLILVTFLLIGS